MPQPLMRRTENDDKRPWGWILILGLVLAAGTASLPLQIATMRQLGEVSRTKQLQDGQRAICSQINDVAKQVGLTPTDCSKINSGR